MRLALRSAPLIAFPRFTAGPDKQAFHRYLTDFEAVADERALLEALSNCHDAMPADMAALLFLPAGTTYRQAVELLCGAWRPEQPDRQ